MGDVLEYPDILQEFRGCMNPGRLKLQSSNFVFKNLKTGKVDTFVASDVDKAHWLIRARGHCLKIILKSGTTHRFDGMKESDYETLAEFIKKHYGTRLEKKDLSVKGWNWGIADFVGNTLDFKVDGLTAFEIPLANISHSQFAKNEVTIEFHQNDDAAVSLMEMRFHIPNAAGNSDVDPVAEFYTNVMAKADVIQPTGDAITTFSEIQCLTPRGRYDIKIYPTFLQLHGKTFDYKIPYTTILRLFLLPHRDSRQMFFVVSLDPPIKQGQTRYHFLIVLFNKEEETTLELALTDEELESKYEGKLSKEMAGPEYEVLSRIMKVLVNKKITVPGSFVGHSGTNSIGCSYKAATGSLYPLERGFIFVHKPPVHIRFDEITTVNFARSAGNTRSFDFEIETKTTPTYNFVGIEKDEYGKLYDFVTQKKLRVKNTNKDNKGAVSYADEMLDSDEDGVDPYMERMKKEGKEREDDGEGAQNDDDSDQDDEDFKPDENASEPDDEYDSNLESTSESEDENGVKKEKKKREPASGSDDLSAPEEDDNDIADDAQRVHKKAKAKKDSKSTKSGKSKKKERDVDQPKRPQSAYFLWLNQNRSAIKEEFPGISVTDLAKKGGERWKDVEDKSKWEMLAATEKASYEVAMTEYRKKPKKEAAESEDDSSKRTKKSKTKTPKKFNEADGFKSKEFISDADSSDEDNDDKPLVKKPKKEEKEKPKEKKEKKSTKKKSKESSEEEEEKEEVNVRRMRKDKKNSEDESDVGELPDEEEILSSPEASAPEESEAESD